MRKSFLWTKKYVNWCKKISELPPNIATPEYMADIVNSEFGKRVFSIDSGIMVKISHPLLYAVGSNAHYVEIHHNYSPYKPGPKPIVLIGKGVTFDTGGYSIKRCHGLHEMKFDKCGAVSVVAVMKALKEQNYPHPVVAIVPFVSNLIGSEQTLPGSVIKSRSGKTVEITDTDAEGRLILADCLTRAQELGPELIITVATLTGSCEAALGKEFTGLFSNESGLICASNLMHAGDVTKDLAWNMPIHPNHVKHLTKCRAADIKNHVSGKEWGGSVAASFLNYFVKPEIAWAHLDIAGTAWDGDRATGRPVKMLLEFLRIIS